MTTLKKVSKEKGVRTVTLDQPARQQVRQHTVAVAQATQTAVKDLLRTVFKLN